MLADQPLIGAGDLVELIGGFKKRAGGHIVVPVAEGRRGNPIVLDEVAIAKILASEIISAPVISSNETDLVSKHLTDNHRFTTDLDTLDDVQQLATAPDGVSNSRRGRASP